jgi:hypothetical protein
MAGQVGWPFPFANEPRTLPKLCSPVDGRGRQMLHLQNRVGITLAGDLLDGPDPVVVIGEITAIVAIWHEVPAFLVSTSCRWMGGDFQHE